MCSLVSSVYNLIELVLDERMADGNPPTTFEAFLYPREDFCQTNFFTGLLHRVFVRITPRVAKDLRV
ncbi:MAG TPA: hypothetical protein EYP19_06420 [Desulfobacterales bacterium]|nr:hypothetical protein [Desulfobacterales bacterium]